MIRPPPRSTLFPNPPLFRSVGIKPTVGLVSRTGIVPITADQDTAGPMARTVIGGDRRSEEHRLNSTHLVISYSGFFFKKKKIRPRHNVRRLPEWTHAFHPHH